MSPVRGEPVPRFSPSVQVQAESDRADPRLWIAVAADRAPALPATGVCLLGHVLRLGEVAADRVQERHHPLPCAAVEGVEMGVVHRCSLRIPATPATAYAGYSPRSPISAED